MSKNLICKAIIIFILILNTVSAQKKSEQYSYKYSIEELKNLYSVEIIERAKKDNQELTDKIRDGKFKSSFESLTEHKTPSWYRDAKLGIFYDWGLYSIAGYGTKGWSRARYPDWYLSRMYNEHKEYHKRTWGEDFHRDDFIPLFKAENFNAADLIELTKLCGAKYLVPFSKHHDGYCLWESKYTFRDAVDMMPGRDLINEIVVKCEKNNIYHGFYFSVEEYEYPIMDDNGNLLVRYWANEIAPDNAGLVDQSDEIIGPFNSSLHNRILSGKIPVKDFINEYIIPQAKDYIDKYDPDILWFDGEWQRPAEYYRTIDLVAYYYNQAEGRKEVVANDRLGKDSRGKYGDFYTSETDEVVDRMLIPWEENRSMSESYGYNHLDSLENYLTPEELVHMLVRIVAKGGNLNLIINPDGTGKISQIQIDLLHELGDWLEINGEAIYGTRPFETLCDNTQLGQPVWYTMSKDSLYGYAIILDWPKSETFICKGANMIWEEEVFMLGYDKPLEWVDTGKRLWGMSAEIPEEMARNNGKRPCDHAWVIKFKYDKDNIFGN